jgi:hypothetical protein
MTTIIQVKIKDLIPAEYNPRKLTEKQFNDIKNSIDKFGIVDPIIANKNDTRKNIVIGGHQRLKVIKELGYKEVPVIYVDLNEKDERELNVRLNKNTGEFDYEILADQFEMEDLLEWGFMVDELMVDFESGGQGEHEEAYTNKIESPIYEPKNEKPLISELYDANRTVELTDEIEKLECDKETKEFLRLAAQRHTVFNYSKIADFYAHSDKEIQNLMENSALIIIDFKKAIENGYVQLSEEIKQQYLKDYPDEK